MLIFVGPDNSKLTKTDDSLFITFEECTEGLTLKDITNLEFDEAMYVRGLHFSGIYALDFYRIYITEPITANECILHDLHITRTEYNQYYNRHWHLVGKVMSGAPIDYKELLDVQNKMRSLAAKIQKNMSLCRKFVYSKVSPKNFVK